MRKKRFLGTIILAVLSWAGLLGIVTLSAPDSLTLLAFFIFLFNALFFTCSLILKNSRRGFFGALYVSLLLFLKFIKMANYLNIVLLTGLFITAEVFFSKK